MLLRRFLLTALIALPACSNANPEGPGSGAGTNTGGTAGDGTGGSGLGEGAGAAGAGTSMGAGAAGGSGTGGTPGTGGGASSSCEGAAPVCTGWNTRAVCTAQGGETSWLEESCAAGLGCVAGVCTANACSDECRAGQAGCALYDVASDSFVEVQASGTHGRARLFERWIHDQTASLFFDQIVSVKYATSSLNDVDSIYIGDSALHTGIYLAAESFKLAATGSADARSNVKRLVERFDGLFHVSGDPGNLATSMFPSSDNDHKEWTNWDCNAFDRHCDVEYDGQTWDYVGDPSRDMYMGPLLGLTAAYDSLSSYDEPHRQMIREALVPFAVELARKRTLPVRLVVNGFALPVAMREARFFIPEPADMIDGAVEISVDFNDISGGAIRGGQEMMPNPSVFFRQWSQFSSVPDVPRASSALMAGGAMRAALHVTEGVPGYEAERAAISQLLLENADDWGNGNDWIELASNWSDHEQDCEATYFGAHIGFIGAYTWGLLETEPALRNKLLAEGLAPVWSDLGGHKNSFFSFGYGRVSGGLESGPLSEAQDQIEQFDAPPRIRLPRSGSCASSPVDVDARPVYFLTWHSNPWKRSDTGNNKQTYPGHDYLVGYWLGRLGGFLNDDAEGTCLRLQ